MNLGSHAADQKEKAMKENLDKVKLFARDLRNGKEFPRSPRETLAGYVLAARALDKCRADLVRMGRRISLELSARSDMAEVR
jgi:Domain of unknown function (DUF5069)